jgi:hypothetical protein
MRYAAARDSAALDSGRRVVAHWARDRPSIMAAGF